MSLALLLLLAAPAPKSSLPVIDADLAWRQAGLRVGLGYVGGALFGARTAPEGPVHAGVLRAGARLDEHWSLLGGIEYGVYDDVVRGLRYAVSVEPTLHLGDLAFSLGVGLAGFVFSTTGAPTPEPEMGLVASYSLTEDGPAIGSCAGSGVIALARADYAFVVSELFSTGPSLRADLQWTECVQSLGRTDPDTGEAILLFQDWRHASVALGWVFWFR